MRYRQLGNTGITVSEVGFGANTVSGLGSYGYVEEAQGTAALQRAYDLGVTLFDTAEGYSEGRSEELIGRVLGDKPDVVVCTKVGGSSTRIGPQRLRPALEASLRRLRRETVDVYLLHNPSTEQVQDPAMQEALRREGLIRAYGVSSLVAQQQVQGRVAMEGGGYGALEVGFNLAEREALPLLEPAAAAGVGIIARTPLGGGLLSGKYDASSRFPEGDRRGAPDSARQVQQRLSMAQGLRLLAEAQDISMVQAALGWVLSHPQVSTVIVGCKSPQQAQENASASGLSLSSAFLEGATAPGVALLTALIPRTQEPSIFGSLCTDAPKEYVW